MLKSASMTKNEVNKLINAHQSLPIYLTVGYRWKGPTTKDKVVTKEELQKTLDWMACADVSVKEDKIEVNAFSVNDMY